MLLGHPLGPARSFAERVVWAAEETRSRSPSSLSRSPARINTRPAKAKRPRCALCAGVLLGKPDARTASTFVVTSVASAPCLPRSCSRFPPSPSQAARAEAIRKGYPPRAAQSAAVLRIAPPVPHPHPVLSPAGFPLRNRPYFCGRRKRCSSGLGVTYATCFD